MLDQLTERRRSLTDAAAPARTATDRSGDLLRVDREDIDFRTDRHGRVHLAVRVRNGGWRTSAPTTLVVEEAEFGAFLPTRPLTKLPVAAIPPGGETLVTATFDVEDSGPTTRHSVPPMAGVARGPLRPPGVTTSPCARGPAPPRSAIEIVLPNMRIALSRHVRCWTRSDRDRSCALIARGHSGSTRSSGSATST